MWRSDPQMPAIVTRTTASVGLRIAGSGASETRMSFAAWNVTARTAPPRDREAAYARLNAPGPRTRVAPRRLGGGSDGDRPQPGGGPRRLHRPHRERAAPGRRHL